MKRPCLQCGELSQDSYCETHKPVSVKSEANRERQAELYDSRWRKLSKKARELQPWCTDCGTRSNLSADHLPQAHMKLSKGIPLTLTDVEVVCIPCNDRRGPAEEGSQRYSTWLTERDVMSHNNEYPSTDSGIHSHPGGIQGLNKGLPAMGVGGSPITYFPDSDPEPNKYSIEAPEGNGDTRR